MCSYLASFPAALAHAFISRYSRPGDVVLDPFAGRGTTPLQAAAEGRIGVGNDLNPFAQLLTAAKVEPAGPAEARTRLARLRLAWPAVAADVGGRAGRRCRPIRTAVPSPSRPRWRSPSIPGRSPSSSSSATPSTSTIGSTASSPPRSPGSSTARARRTCRTSCPTPSAWRPATCATSRPGRTSIAGERDVFDCLEAKLDRLFRAPLPAGPGISLLGDARDAGARARAALRARGLPDRARLVVTSPPYLRVVKYGYYNWLRAWFLGEDPRAIDAALDDAHHRAPYLVFLREVLHGLRTALTDDAVVVLVIGDVATDRGRTIRNGIDLAEGVWAAAAAPEGYKLAGVALDEVHANRKMTKLWGDEAGRATQMDRILVLGATEAGRRRALSAAGFPVEWTWPPRLRAL